MSLMKYAPPPFYDESDTAEEHLYAFGKIWNASYEIVLDLERITGSPKRGVAQVEATLDFEAFVNARPVLEFMKGLSTKVEVSLDGWKTTADYVSTDHDQWRFFGLEQEAAPGRHTIVISYQTELNVGGGRKFSFMRPEDPGVYWHFRMSDCDHTADRRDDCNFLGRYLPTNLEFDAHPRTIRLSFDKIRGTDKELILFTNGQVGESPHSPVMLEPEVDHRIVFPDDFRSSSVFFYLADPEKLATASLRLPFSTPMRSVTIVGSTDANNDPDYESRPARYVDDVWKAADVLHRDFGPLPTEHVTLLAGRQGMEYAGAAEISGGNVLHELFHLYFARWIVPTDGASGWWDEALAHWYTSGCPSYPEPGDEAAALGVAPPYRRWTDEVARTKGTILIGYLDHCLRDKGGMLAFLRHLVVQSGITPLDSRDFQTALETWAGRSFKREFDRYVWGTQPVP